jgi:hypothetical protein
MTCRAVLRYSLIYLYSCRSSVSIVTRIWAGRPGSIPRRDSDGKFSLRHRDRISSGAQPVSFQRLPGAHTTEVNLSGHGAASSAEVRMCGDTTSLL